MRMFYGHGHCGGHGCGNCGCHGRGHGNYSDDHGRGNDHGHFCPTPPPIHLDALEILRRRYASGEIDDATFQHMRERLGASAGPERPPEG
ncbi:MAG TPA: SHOCT domain-containing protein [Ktedonobacteraceae bacterium]|nr:SHOCT domain-containing protein [Ktedonobacteraceae bacterium]